METLVLLAADYASMGMGIKLNVMGIFNSINAARFPMRHPSMYVIAKLGVEFGEQRGKRQVSIKLIDQDGHDVRQFVRQEVEVKNSMSERRAEFNFLLEVRDLILPAPGTYSIVVVVDDEPIRELPIIVNQIRKPAAG